MITKKGMTALNQKILDALTHLRSEEGDVLYILSDNPEASTRDYTCAIEICGAWTGWKVFRVYDISWRSAVMCAHQLRKLCEQQDKELPSLPQLNKIPRVQQVHRNGMSLVDLQRRCFAQAKKSGWAGPGAPPVPFLEAMALVHSEVSEAVEAWRDGQAISWTDEGGKPQGIGSEFADIIIRLGHYASIFGVDLEAEVERKLKYNATRPYRHGGKKA